MKKIITSVIMLIMLNFIIVNDVSASTGLVAKLDANAVDVKANDQVEITLKFDNLKEVTKGINAYKATLQYDKNIFEEVVESSFINQNRWESLKYNPSNGEFVAINKVGITAPEDVIKIKLKVKANANGTKTTIKIKNITSSEGRYDIFVDETSLELNIIKNSTKPNTNKPTNNETVTNKVTTSSNIIGSKVGHLTKPNTISNNNNDLDEDESDAPQDKDDSQIENPSKGEVVEKEETIEEIEKTVPKYTILFILLLLLLIVLIIMYLKKKSEDGNKKKYMFLLIVGIVGFMGSTVALAYNFAIKGELNGDSKINYADLSLLELHLIDLKRLPDDRLENADMNSDGKITVTDLSLLVQKLELTLDYTVDISNIEIENRYPTKNQDINIKISGDVSYGASIKKLIIDGKEYSVEKQDDNKIEYTLKLNIGNKYGFKTYKITEALLDNKKRVKIDYKIEVDVLKDIPSINNYNVIEDIDNSKLILSFDVIDNDDSIDSASVIIYNSDQTIMTQSKIVAGHNIVEIKVEENKEYKAHILLEYDLDSNRLEDDLDHSGTFQYERDLQLITDYDFKISNIKTYKDLKETTTFDKGDQVKIMFESTNKSKFEPAIIKIDGKEYDLEKDGDKYSVTIDSLTDIGSKIINIEEVMLANGRRFTIGEDNSLKIDVIKRKPTISNVDTTENVESNDFKVMFDLVDKDKSIEELNIILYDDNDEKIDHLTLDGSEIDTGETIRKYLEGKMTTKYRLQILVDYNLTLNADDKVIDEVLYDSEIEPEPRVIINDVMVDSDYVLKGGSVKLIYDLNSNRKEDIVRIVVNNTNYMAYQLEDGNYQVTVDVSKTAGIYPLTTTSFVYSDGKSAPVQNTKIIDILKDKPSIENFTQDDDVSKKETTLKFNVVDNENSFISGKAVLTLGDTSVEKEVVKGNNELTFKVEPENQYTLEIKVTYDLDTNTLLNPEEDNRVVDEVIDTRKIELIADYRLNLNNIKTYNEKGETKYFNKSEPVQVSFESNNITNFEPVKAVVNDIEYDLIKKDNAYYLMLDGYETSGVKTALIEKVVLSNSKGIIISENNEIKVTVLKDKPTVEQFGYVENQDNTVTATLNIVDKENALTGGKIVITNRGTVIKEQAIEVNQNTITFKALEGENYILNVIADYDLDMNVLEDDANEYHNITLFEADITLGERRFEVKDITNTILYKKTADGVSEVINLNVDDLANLDDYIVKVQTKEMPTFYTKVIDYKIEANQLKLTLDYDNVVQYTSDSKQNKLEIVYGNIDNGVASNISFEELIRQMTSNPSGNFTLTRDYDASTISTNTATLITTSFVGTLNGNGYKIYNLNKPLFDNLEGTVENLKIEKVKLSGANSRGAIANTASNATIKNVHISELELITGANHTAGIIGEATNVTIESSSVVDFTITTSGHVRIAAIVGKMTDGLIKNCYVEGSINSSQNKDGNGIGGILGHGYGIETIENCIAKINFTNNVSHRLNGGIVGLFMNRSSVLRNNVSLSTGTNFYSIHGNEPTSTAINNYELADSGLTSNASNNRVITITKENITSEFFKDTVNFDEDIWNLSDASYDNPPTLKSNQQSSDQEEVENAKLYIPDYSRIKKISGYTDKKDILYHNINKLMPYYDAKYLIEDGLKVSIDDILNTKIIKHILPYNNEGLVTYLTGEDYNDLTKLKVVFDDDTIKEYKLHFKKMAQNISIYEIDGLNLDYAYDNYLVEEKSSIVNTLEQYIKNLDYTKDLDSLTTAEDSRLYRDYYNQTIKGNAKNIALQLLQNDSNNSLTLNSDILNSKIKEELIDSGKLKSILYAYNYYDRWYHFEIDGSKVSDIMMFDGNMFSDSMTLENLTDDVLTGSIGTNVTWNFYGSKISKYTTNKTNLGVFLDYLIQNIGGYSDVNDWLTQNYKGIVYEIPALEHPDVEYRAWRQLKQRTNYLLPFVTLPDNAAYIVSSPTQFLIGSQRTYITNPDDPAQRQQLLNMIVQYSKLISNFYSTTAGFIEADRLNAYTDIQVDCRTADGGYQVAGTTEEPFHKNFNEAVGYWAAANGAAAYATGSNVYWVAYRALSIGSFPTWSHETGHNQDNKIFLKGGGRRGTAEEYADGNTSQGAGDGGVNFNLAYERSFDYLTTTNLTPERINSTEKIESYYRRMYEVWDFLDYAYAKAFLQLTPEEQSKVGVQIDYPDNNAFNTRWSVKSASDFADMNLTTIEDLWDNKIVIKPGVTSTLIRYGGGKYGYEGIYPTRWYQPHNDNGRGDCYTFKLLAWEMLGVGGYDGGYATYYSKRSANDLDAIRKVTGDSTMTWKKYKMSRYDLMETYWNNLPYIDAEEIYDEYLEALKLDAKNSDRNATASMNVKRRMYHYLKRVTNDFRSEVFTNNAEVIHIKTAEQFKQAILNKPYGNFILDNDIDVSNLTGTNAIIDGMFYGKLDGNGHKIIGNKMPLFQKLRFAYVTNLKFDSVNIETTNSSLAAALTPVAEYATITDISSTNTNVVLNGTIKTGVSAIVTTASISYTDNIDVAINKISIKSVDDFSKINDAPGKIYSIDADLDFTGYTKAGSIITNTFTGKLEGNGHTISNLNNSSLFSTVTGTIENLNIRDFTNISTGDDIAALAKLTNKATIKNIKFDNIVLEGRHRVAVVSGFDNANSTFENISVKNANVKATGVYASTFIGRKYGGSIKNVFVEGNIEITMTENGGIAGTVQKGGTIENVVSKVNIHKPRNTYTSIENSERNGGIVGNIYDNSIIKNSIALGDMEGFIDNEGNEKIPYKLAGATATIIASTIENCYEYVGASGFSSITDETKDMLKEATSADIHTKAFYKDTLHFDESIWNLDVVSSKGYPELK